MSDIGILAYGAYLPYRRLSRSAIHKANAWFAPGMGGLAKGERATAGWDEDTITMAVEAGRACLAYRPRDSIAGLALGSTTFPFADRLNAGIVKEALNLEDRVGAADFGGSQRAATTALSSLLSAATTASAPHLCLASDLRKARPGSETEMLQGDGAAAVLVGRGDPIARLLSAYSETMDFVDHFRATGQDFDYGWEARWVREEGYLGILATAIAQALEQADCPAESIDRLIVPIAARNVPQTIAKRLGIPPEAVADTMTATIGDTGAAHPLLMLSAALEAAGPGEKILVVGFGQGADVLLFETTEAIATATCRGALSKAFSRKQSDDNYMRFLFHRGLLEYDKGMRAEADEKQPGSTLYRRRKAVFALVGGRCTRTGTVEFPRSDISVTPNSHAIGTQEDYPLADLTARIVTHTADSLTYSPNPPLYYGMVDFEGGGRLVTEFTDCDGSDIEVGRDMRMMFRIKAADEQRHFVKYFWKAAPVHVATGEA